MVSLLFSHPPAHAPARGVGNLQHETSIAINTTGGGEAHVFRVTPRTLCTRGALSALWEAEPPRVGPREASHLDPAAAASTETTADADSQVSCYGRSLPHFPAYYGCCLSTFCALLGTKLWNTTPPSLGHKESHQWISNVWHIKSTRPLTAAPTTDMSAQFLPCLQSRHWGSIVAGSSAATHRQERNPFAPQGSAVLHPGGYSVYSYPTAKACFEAGTKVGFPEQLYNTTHHRERHVAHCIGVTKGSCNAPDMCSRHSSHSGVGEVP